MVKLLLVLTCLCVASAFEISLGGFDSFCEIHGKQYAAQDRMTKFKTWSKNMEDIKELQKRIREENKSYTVGENMFTDMTDEEKLKYIARREFMESAEFQKFNSSLRHPSSIKKWRNSAVHFDWRTSSTKVVNPVKNQGVCGSCWAFAAIAAIETQYALRHNGELHQWSEQELLDCDSGSRGCYDGRSYTALDMSITRGNTLSSDYPYTGVQGSCKSNMQTFKVVESFKRLDTVSAIETFVQNSGPAVVYIDFPHSFHAYNSGIFDPEDWECDERNGRGGHWMAVVGYGTENGIDYWIVRNSWGTYWGEDGYIRIVKGVNKCRIETVVYGSRLYGRAVIKKHLLTGTSRMLSSWKKIIVISMLFLVFQNS